MGQRRVTERYVRVSINQGRVGFRDHWTPPHPSHPPPVSINQGRVGFRDVGEFVLGAYGNWCPSIRAASASATPGPHEVATHADVSINQGRVGFRDRYLTETGATVLDVSINQGRVGFRDGWQPVRRRRATRVSINQGRVGFRDRASPRLTTPHPGGVHQSGPRRLPRPSRISRIRVDAIRVHQSGPRRLPRQPDGCLVHRDDPVSINQGRVGFRDGAGVFAATHEERVSINQGRVGFRDGDAAEQVGGAVGCPSIRAASASATTTQGRKAGYILACPSIRAASASATLPARPTATPREVSINQGRVGFRDTLTNWGTGQAVGVHQSGPRRLPRHFVESAFALRPLCPSIRAASASATVVASSSPAASVRCPSIRAASASATA